MSDFNLLPLASVLSRVRSTSGADCDEACHEHFPSEKQHAASLSNSGAKTHTGKVAVLKSVCSEHLWSES